MFFGLKRTQRLSALETMDPSRALIVPTLGGLVFGLGLLLVARWRPAREVDAIEANALHGGRMSLVGEISIGVNKRQLTCVDI